MKLYLVETSDGKFVTDASPDVLAEARANYTKRKMKHFKNIRMDQMEFKSTPLPEFFDELAVIRTFGVTGSTIIPDTKLNLENKSHEFGE